MNKKSILTILLFSVLILFLVLDKLGLTLVSYIVGGIVTIASFILNLSNIKSMNKKLLTIVMSVIIIPGLIFLYIAFFMSGNDYLLYGSLILFFSSFIVSFIIISIYRKRNIKK